MAKLEIPVKAMHCDGCERSLSRAAMRLDGVLDAKADHQAERVTVQCTTTPRRWTSSGCASASSWSATNPLS